MWCTFEVCEVPYIGEEIPPLVLIEEGMHSIPPSMLTVEGMPTISLYPHFVHGHSYFLYFVLVFIVYLQLGLNTIHHASYFRNKN